MSNPTMESIPQERKRRERQAKQTAGLEEVRRALETVQSTEGIDGKELAQWALQGISLALAKLQQQSQIQLSSKEAAVLAALTRAAESGAPCPTADDLLEAVGFGSHSTTVAVVQRLERRGLIVVERYQRGRRVQIVATGAWTRKPQFCSPHWRAAR